MYLYLHDEICKDPSKQKLLQKIEERLRELSINGRTESASIFRNGPAIIENSIEKGIHTVVGVGDDSTFSKLLHVVQPYDVTFGFIPLTKKSYFAQILGIPYGEDACEMLSKRLTRTISMPKLDNTYFAHFARLEQGCKKHIRIDDTYTVNIPETDECTIWSGDPVFSKQTPQIDGVEQASSTLLVTARPMNGKNPDYTTFIQCEKAYITASPPSQVTIDDAYTYETPATITIDPAAQSVIVGRIN